MKSFPFLSILTAMTLASCGDDTVADRDQPLPTLNQMVEDPLDWSLLGYLVDRRPAESELLMQSPITVDLNAMVGPDIFEFRKRMNRAGPLVRRGQTLVSVTPAGPDAAYLIIEPAERVIEAGWWTSGGWRVERTAGSEIARPPEVEALLAG